MDDRIEIKRPHRPRFAMIDPEIMRDPGLSVTARTLYAVIACYADEDRECWPSVATLAIQVGATDRTVQRALSDLEEYGALRRRPRPGRASVFVLLDLKPKLAVVETPDTDVTPTPDTSVTPPPTPVSPRSRTKELEPRKGPRKRGCTIENSDFKITPQLVAWAKAKAPDVDGKLETEKFWNYWKAKSGREAVKADWPATWRNWMLRSQERLNERKTTTTNRMSPAQLRGYIQA